MGKSTLHHLIKYGETHIDRVLLLCVVFLGQDAVGSGSRRCSDWYLVGEIELALVDPVKQQRDNLIFIWVV